jgi:N utilization substance protein B
MNIKKNYPSTPRVKIIQKLYGSLLNPDQEIIYTKNQYKKFIKDIVSGTLERKELIEETILKNISEDINLKRTDKLLKIIIFAAVFELIFKHKNSINVIISEYLKASEFFLEPIQIKYLNAILDKISKKIRNNDSRA